MSESNKESCGGGFVSSITSTQLPGEEQQGERSQDNEKAEDRSIQESRPVPPLSSRHDEHTLDQQGMNREGEEVDQEGGPVLSRKAISEEFSKLQDKLRHPYPNQPRQQSSNSESEVLSKSGRVAANEMDSGHSYSHYPTSDTRTGESEPIQQHRLGLTGPGFSNALSGRGRIWETDRYDGWENRNRERTRDVMPPKSLSSTSLFTDSQERERKRGEREDEYSNTNASRRSILPASAELALPVSKIREGGEDYPYSSPFAATSIHRSREDTAVGFATRKPSSSAAAQISSSISHAEENSSTPPVPRARNESVSDSSSASAISHTPISSQNRYSPDPMSKKPPSPLDAQGDHREERRKQPSWITADVSSSSTRVLSYSSRQDDSIPSRPGASSRDRGTSMIAPPDIEDSTYHHGRSHVSRSPDISYFQTASSKSGTTNTNTVFQGSKTYHSSQQDIFKESRQHQQHYPDTSSRPSSEYSRIQSDHAGTPSSSSPTSYISHARPGPDNIGIERPPLYPPGYGGKDINVGRRFARSNPGLEDSRSHEPRVGRSTSSTPPIPDHRDALKQRTYTEYQRTVPSSRQDERSAESRKSTQEPERAESSMQLDSTHGFSGGLYSVLKGARAGPSSDVGTNPPPSKATSSYSTPSTTSVSLSPVLSKTLPSLRETFASPTISTEPLPPPPPSHNLNSTAITSGRQQTVTIPPAQTPSRPIPGGPWLYDGEEPDLEEDDGVNAPDEAGRPKKRRRTRVALSCAECKRRKIKCDRAQPCTPCARRGDQSNCKWAVMETKDGTPTRAEFETLQNRVVQLERLLFSIAPQLKPGH